MRITISASQISEDDAHISAPDPFGRETAVNAFVASTRSSPPVSYLCLNKPERGLDGSNPSWPAYRMEFEVWSAGNHQLVAVVATRLGVRYLMQRDNNWIPDPAPQWLVKQSAKAKPLSAPAAKRLTASPLTWSPR